LKASLAALGVVEAVRNLVSSPTRTIVLAVGSVIVGAIIATATVVEVDRVVTVASQQEIAGAYAFEVVAPGGAAPAATRCNSLQNIDGVIAAGGVMATTGVRLDVQPDEDARILVVTPGYIAAAWPDLPDASKASVIAGSGFGNLGWQAGSVVHYTVDGTSSNVSTRLDDVTQHPSMLNDDRVLVQVAPPAGTVAVCLVRARADSAASVSQALRGSFGAGTSIQDVLIRSSLLSDPQQLLDSRVSQLGWAFGGLVIAVLLIGGWVARRGEFALYRLLGFPDRGILAMLTVETVALGLIPAQLGALIGIGIHHLDPLVANALVLDWLRFDLLIVLIPLAGISIIPRGSLLATLKGR
jgi:hypothetical protein